MGLVSSQRGPREPPSPAVEATVQRHQPGPDQILAESARTLTLDFPSLELQKITFSFL
jgi:hypothetical protein